MADITPMPAGIHVRFINDIAILSWNNGENRLNVKSIGKLNQALDQIEKNESVKALMITGAGKYFSCGLDLEWLVTQDTPTLKSFVSSFDNLILRLLVYPMPTIAAINGHAFAGGAFVAMACDYRIMRSQLGWICFPEINLKMPLRGPLAEMVRVKMRDNLVFRDMMVFGDRLTGEEAKQKGVVDDCVDITTLINTSLAFIKKRVGSEGYDRITLHKTKQNLYGTVVTSRQSREDTSDNVSPQQLFKRALKASL